MHNLIINYSLQHYTTTATIFGYSKFFEFRLLDPQNGSIAKPTQFIL